MSKTIILKSCDGESFEVDEAVALKCETIKNMIEDKCTDNGVPLANVNGATLAKVIVYLKKHVEAAARANAGDEEVNGSNEVNAELKTWDEDFVKVDQHVLFDLMLAANYLIIPGLLNLTCETVADMMRGKTPNEIRTLFNINNDYTPEEEAAVRDEHAWAFQ